ncbi:MAG TPA: hypothetical protein VJS12_24305 [Steroidobacteraceae bacterium]|nr:hypothetical protein [Steroidobacteraceae bacterium]
MSIASASPGSEVVVFGAGELAVQAHERIDELGLRLAAFVVDDDRLGSTTTLRGVPVMAFSRLQGSYPPARCAMFVAVGYRHMRARRAVFERIRALGYRCINLISPHANVARDVAFGTNNLVFASCVVESGAALGDNNVLWSGATVCHDSRLGNHNFLAPRTVIAGNCRVGDLCFFGVGVAAIDGLTVSSESYLMAGSVLFADTAERGRYRGNPAALFGHCDPARGIELLR